MTPEVFCILGFEIGILRNPDSDPDSDSKKTRTRGKPGPGLEENPDSPLRKPGLDLENPDSKNKKTGFETRNLLKTFQIFRDLFLF